MSATLLGVIGIAVFLILIFMGMNIGLALLLVGAAGYAMIVNPAAAIGLLRKVPATQAGTYTFIVIVLFIMMGNFAYQAGLSSALYKAANKWLSRLPGNLACGTIAASAGFGAICGSCAATCATMGAIALPEMRKYKYADMLSTGTVAMGGTLGILIPPSTPMIIYCIMAETSIGKMFAAGVLPGVVLAALCVITVVIMVKLKPSMAPPPSKCAWRERFASLKGLAGVVVLFGAVLGGMFSGFFSVNQSAAVGAFLAIVLTAINGKLNWKSFTEAMRNTVTTFSMTFLILIGASVFCNFLAITKIPFKLADLIASMHVSFGVVLIMMTLVYIVLGMLMDELPMIILTVPIFLPIVQNYGVDPIWFGIYVILVMELGAIAPPVGLNCFIIHGIAKDIPMGVIYRGALPFVATILAGVALIYFFPQIVLILPGMMGG
ncbi:MAG: TRAP transporter large permease [Clostridiales Family XIII bacterium]|jgi:tripartite ATP-independent transporter DctM subunit|nr:TRAP transporter large permease [Clostridiales Family XIII bacterium]